MAKRRRYPWSVLEIDPSTNETDIKRAYAAKLKQVRPDVDPEAFQNLVQARDVALANLSKEVSHSPLKSVKAKRSRPKGRIVRSESTARSSTHRKATEVARSEDGDDFELLEIYLTSFERTDLRERAFAAVKSLQSLSIDEKVRLEPGLIQAVSKALPVVEFMKSNAVGLGRNTYFDKSKLIYLIDKEYGWSNNDAETSLILGDDNPQFADQLQDLLYPDRHGGQTTRSYNMPFWQKTIGVIFLALVALKIVRTLVYFVGSRI